MNRRAAAILCCCLPTLAVPAAAQRQPQEDPVRAAREELGRKKRELGQLKTDTESLLDLRVRHDLGLPVPEADDLFQYDGKATTESLDKARRQLQSEDQQSANLLQRFEKLKQQVAELKAAAVAAQDKGTKEDPEWVVVPRPGETGRRPAGDGAPAGTAPATAPPAEPAPVPPAAEGSTPAAPHVVANLDPIRGQIHGSSDDSRVAHALFRAAQSLTDQADGLRARQPAVADELDAKARERLQKAIEVLAVTTQPKTAPLADLFCLGKCREALFRIDERHAGLDLATDARTYNRRAQEVRDPFIAITARDVTTRDGHDTLGPWGMAAQTADDHFRWMNLHGGFRPKTSLETIKWAAPSK